MLQFVAWLPSPTAVLGEHGDTTAGAVFYACSISALGASAALIVWYATGDRRLVDDRLSDEQIRHLRLRSLIVPAVYLPSIPVAFVSPLAATLLWLLTFALGFVLDRVVPPPA
jgi:uncharacterized membrane protein